MIVGIVYLNLHTQVKTILVPNATNNVTASTKTKPKPKIFSGMIDQLSTDKS